VLASVCAACLAAPFVAGLVALLVEARVPVRLGGDSALIELATREASEGARLLGPYSRFGWNHPGPLYFYLLALPYRAAAGDPRGLYAGVLGLNGAAALAVIALLGGTVAVGLATRISGVILGYLLFWMAAVPVAGLLGGAVLAARGLRWRRWRHAAAAGRRCRRSRSPPCSPRAWPGYRRSRRSPIRPW
jgi:hypothetical protein